MSQINQPSPIKPAWPIRREEKRRRPKERPEESRDDNSRHPPAKDDGQVKIDEYA